MKHFLMTAAALAAFSGALAQGNSYTFTATTAAWQPLTGAQVLRSTDFDAGGFYTLPLNGETFQFYKIPFPMGGVKTFAIQPNGNLRIDNDSTLIIVDGAFTYLDSADASSEISYTLTGAPGNKVIKAQWKNLNIRVGQPGNRVSLQIVAYQQSGVVEIHFGPRSASNASGFNTTSGPQVGMFFSRDDFSQCFEKLWVNGSPASYTLDSVKNYTFRAMSGVPDSGVVFRFTPRFISSGIASPDGDDSRLTVYPNPACGKVFYSIHTQHNDPSLTICDAAGRLMAGEERIVKLSAHEGYFDVGHLRPGLYTLLLRTAGQVRVEKVLITE